MKTLICDCNGTMPLDVAAIGQALARTPGASTDGLETVHHVLCRREAPAFQRAAVDSGRSGDELLVACTQEQRLFLELNDQTEGAAGVQERPIRFVNIRETGGWSRGATAATATPRIAALIAAAQAPAPEPVPTVTYRSGGRCLVIGPAEAATQAAALLADRLELTLLIDRPGGALPQRHEHAAHHGRLTALTGWLGVFTAQWTADNPIDLDLCTRCNACVEACPEGAIGLDYRIDLDACRSHRDCVRVCEAAGAIDFGRETQTVEETFDLVLDLREAPAFTMHQVPQGYFHVPHGAPAAPSSDYAPAGLAGQAALTRAVLALRDLTGEFEKPKFFRYQPRLCAHSRNEQIGCTACIDVCSAQAIRSDASRKGKTGAKGPRRTGPGPGAPIVHDGGGVVVEPFLCVGCGACSTVCPSGAMSFAYPGTVDQGRRMRTLLGAYAQAGGRAAALLIHSEGAGTRAIEALGRAARAPGAPSAPGAPRTPGSLRTPRPPSGPAAGVQGLPARVLPVAVWHTASVGLDLWLSAIAQGASQVWVLLTDEEAPDYRRALREQIAVAQALLEGLGYAGEHLRLIETGNLADPATLIALDQALRAPAAATVARAGTFGVQADKRATLEMALDHLLAQAPARPAEIALPAAGAPFGSLVVDPAKCTLCLSCVGACPQAALADNPDKPQLRFIEKNCVQCGLCATTCPEQAITLQPRLWLADEGKARKALRVLNEAEPWHCVKCAKPFGTLRAIESMIDKLGSHAAFQGAAAERLKMCSDCRVVDMYSRPDEVRITDL